MLTNPFSGKELFIQFEFNIRGISKEMADELWEENTGKSKKAAWNNLAKMINGRMRGETDNGHSAQKD